MHASVPAAAYNTPVDVFQLAAVLNVLLAHPLMVTLFAVRFTSYGLNKAPVIQHYLTVFVPSLHVAPVAVGQAVNAAFHAVICAFVLPAGITVTF